MKKLYFLLLFVLISLNVHSQIVNIPDGNFKARLLLASTTQSIAYDVNGLRMKVDVNNDGNIQVSEAINVYQLDVAGRNIQNMTGIEEFLNIRVLFCFNNNLTSLNLAPNINLQLLYCHNNDLTTLILPQTTSLTEINCNNNNLTNLNVSQNTALTELNLISNQLSNIDLSQNIALTILMCEGNQLTNLSLIENINLTHLSCNYNQLTNLDLSQNINLTGLDCTYNQLNNLNVDQNINLITLNCSYNQLTSLNTSQNTVLGHLNCYNNQLSSLDLTQNNNLGFLDCSNNQLLTLDVSHNRLTYLRCNNNQLETLFMKNGIVYNYIQSLFFNSNPNLQFICTDEGEISQVQSRINQYGYTSTCHVNSYCSFDPGGTFYTIQGTTRFDNNSNGCDINDFSIPNQRFEATDGTISGSFIANESGNFSIPIQNGTHTISPVLENPSYFEVSPLSAIVSFPSETSPFNQEFCVTANGIKNDLEITIIPIEVARPGFNAQYKIVYKNKGNQIANGTLTFSFDDTVMDLVSSFPIVDGSEINSLNWNFTDLNPFETREINLIFNINSPMETPAVNGGDILVYTATIVGATDETPNDNAFTLNQTVVNSYDPNDKTCLEGNTISPEMVGEYVHYVIRFENTGTFAAENVVIADVIDATKFEISTLIPQSSSHDFFTRINGNKVEFIFENINLPFEDENNDGYIAFKIKTKPNLVVGNTFTNKANIYFDYNFPIITNTTSTTVEEPLSNQDFDFETNFTLYPNPAKDVLNIKVKNEIDVKSISIYNTLGQIIMTTIHAENGEINVSNLQTGSYFITLFTDKGSSTAKFIKQ